MTKEPILYFLLALIVLTEAADDLCNFTKYKESKSLEASKKKLSPFLGKSYKSRDEHFEFTVGICTRVAENIDKEGFDKENVAVLQQGLKDDGSINPLEVYNIGSLTNTHIMAGMDWILLEYWSNEKYGSHCSKELKHTAVMITCDQSVDDSDARMVFIEEENQKESHCYYLFEMRHKAVCAVPSSGGLSVGSILLIVFFSVASVYLFVGFLYSRFVLGAKGIEQIPNYEFWKDFGNLQADGCDFLCRTREHRRGGGFRGIGDDQLDQTDDLPVVRDENLLPM
ncbi:cation-dependent mannose-6-phosphate receptor-like [Elysia marginata]|uniref:Cation-dependent mannose-6-phosphate receptor-like n=1 Tax=Elysia marginata TaxID=1093978 RepID=A0AAV4G134_9GAST|nr:cation-dependent mannose-6-phosphate receptor-like [Elysia marginata]